MLKKKHKRLLIILIPRHIKRINEIIEKINYFKLNYELHSKNNPLKSKTDIYVVDTYGETEKFYLLSNLVFMGGSLIRHGGQNPLEPARLGCNVLYGPHVDNFKEVYNFLKKLKISTPVKNINILNSLLLSKLKESKKMKNHLKIKQIGKKILNNNMSEIVNFLNK